MYGMIYRHLWLPFFDGVLKGRKTLSHWRTLEESQWWPRERLEEFQLHALRRLLDHAAGTCPYYHEMFREQGLNSGILRSRICGNGRCCNGKQFWNLAGRCGRPCLTG